MAEILSIRTLMKMHAFEHIPNDGAISSTDLAKKIGSQESLLGTLTHSFPRSSPSPPMSIQTRGIASNSSILARFLRALVALGILQQTENGDFAHTKNSRIYTSALGSFFQTMYVFRVDRLAIVKLQPRAECTFLI
jgi:hypothetical protein